MNAAPLIAVVLLFESVRVRTLLPLMPMLLGEKVLVAVGRLSTCKVSLALTAFDPALVVVTPPAAMVLM